MSGRTAPHFLQAIPQPPRACRDRQPGTASSPTPLKRGTLVKAAGPRTAALGRKVQGGGSCGKRQMLDGEGGREREKEGEVRGGYTV